MPKKVRPVVTRDADELAKALGLSPADAAEIRLHADLNAAIVEAVRRDGWTHARLAKAAGTSRTRVTAILNRDTSGVSTDLLLRLVSALGYTAKVTVRRRRAKAA